MLIEVPTTRSVVLPGQPEKAAGAPESAGADAFHPGEAMPSTFRQLADQANAAAAYNAFALGPLEHLAAREPSAINVRALMDTKRAADQMAELGRLLEALAPVEPIVRLLLERRPS